MGDYTQVPTPPADLSAVASAKVDPVATPSAQPDAPVLDPNRPVSTIPADSSEATSSAQPEPADSEVQPIQQPELQPDQVLEGSASAEITPPTDSKPTASGSIDSPPSVPQSPQAPQVPQQSDVQAPVASPVPAEPQSPPVSVPPEVSKESGIQDAPPVNQPPQVQPEAPQNTPVTQGENTPSQSAGIKPELPQGTQNAPPAVSKNTESPKPTSFGDLMGTPADLSEAPAIHIDPIESPKKEPEVPIAPQVPQPPVVDAVSLRQKSMLARKKKREENLVSIMEFVQKKGTVKNLDVRDFLHISQTTATDYLHTLVSSGKLKKEGKAKATTYSL